MPLRFGVMCSAQGLPQYAVDCIGHLLRDNLAELVLLIVDEAEVRPSSLKEKAIKAAKFDGNLWYLHNKFFPLRDIPAYRTEPLSQRFGGTARIVCRPQLKGKWSQIFSKEDVEAIRAHNLDFVLKFAFGIVRGEILQSARLGIWSFHHDDEEKYRGGPPAFWEIVKGDPTTGALLQRLTDRLDGGIVLKKCFVATEGRSYRRNLQRIHASTAHMVRWVCLDIAAGKADYLNAPPSKTQAPIYHAPNDWQMLVYLGRLGLNWLRCKIENQRIDEWNVALINSPQAAFLDSDFQPKVEWSSYKLNGQMIADPFPLLDGAQVRVLVEELSWDAERGRISELRRSSPNGPLNCISAVMESDCHMSYPFVLEHDDSTFMIPETGETRNIRLYRLDRSTGTWNPEAILMEDIDALDTTILRHDDKWWLFHSGNGEPGIWSLYVWSASDLLGPWTPHPANPVKTDLSSSRPAGNLFYHEGKLYRPAQDGRLSYGGALAINRIDVLTSQAYSETVVRRIHPDPNGPYPDGLHTLSGSHGNTVIDSKKHRWPIGLILRRALRKRLRVLRALPLSHSAPIVLSAPAPYSQATDSTTTSRTTMLRTPGH